VAETIAAAREIPLKEVADATTETAEGFFQFNRT
jgi:Tat protein secretion system quality control protein TatD with DNase activity